MKRFITKCGLTIILAIVLLVVLELMARNVPNDYSMKNALMSESAPKIKTLVLGNSQAYFGINPIFFDKPAFNLAHVSQPLNIDRFLFEKFQPKMENLENIIFCISYFTPFTFWRVNGEGEAWRIKHYHLYYGYPIKKIDIANNLELFNLNYKHDIRWLKAILGKSLVYTDSLGFGRNYLKFHAPNWEECRSEVKIHTIADFQTNKNAGINFKIIDDIAKGNRNKKIILFIPPAWNSYRSNIDKCQMDYVVDFCDQLQEDNSNIIFVDLFSDSRFTADDFADAYHLSESGAKKLTLILNELIESET